MTEVLAAVAAAAAGWGAGRLVRLRWSQRVLAHPGPRSSHTVPTTRLGGVAIAAGLLAGALAAGAPGRLVGGAAAAAAVGGAAGMAEDLRGVPVPGRLALQAVAAVAAVALIGGGWPMWTVGGLWVVAYVNAYNFMDGIDGLAAAQLGVAGLAWVAVGAVEGVEPLRVVGAVAVGSAAGFLPHNWSPARMFMGDLGSYAAGAWLAAGALVGLRLGVAPVAVLAPLALFCFDTGWTLVRRRLRGENVVLPHRSHLYQQLEAAGWGHARTTALVALVVAGTSAAGLLALRGGAAAQVAAVALVAALLAGYWLLVRRVTR